MGSLCGYHYGFWETNPALWERCKKAVSDQMLAKGWNRHARKFDDVMKKKAMKLFYESVK